MDRRFRLAACALAMATASEGAFAAPSAADPSTDYHVEAYEVALRPDVSTTALTGRETIRVAANVDRLEAVAFSPNALAIVDARVDGTPVMVESDGDGIVFHLPHPLAAGETALLSFDIAGRPMRGLSTSDAGIWSGYFACDWMVCRQDYSGDKASIALDLYVPTGLDTQGVGVKWAERDLGGGLTLHRWRSVDPVSPYLFAFAAGRFPQKTIETPQGTLHYRNATGASADLASLFAETPAMVAFFADRAGMDLPRGGYTQLLVPGREALETMSFSLIGKGELDRETDEPEAAWVIAHELTHQWWGNRVTTETWRDFWLNEGVATFMTAAWKQERFGNAAYAKEIEILRGRRAQLIERGWDKPLAWSGDYPSLGYRRAVQYSKGALFLAELRAAIGEEAFWSGLRAYTRSFAGKTVVSRDFQKAMERASGSDLSAIFGEWVYGPAKA